MCKEVLPGARELRGLKCVQKVLDARLYECKCMQNARKDSGGILEENRGLNAKVWKRWGLQAGVLKLGGV